MQPSQAPQPTTQQPPAQDQQQGQGSSDGTEFGAGQNDIMQNLDQHLNQIPDDQKQILAQALKDQPQVIIPVLGIVCGQEVYDYFMQLYQKFFAQNSSPGQPQGQAPQAAPQPGMGPKMAPMSMPSNNKVMNVPQPQAKATPSPMG